jgi:tetratricopeptide (TPR) repeat protein
MSMETNIWQAFSLATDALRDIDSFVSSSSKNRALLIAAQDKLKSAVDKDPNFVRARYYSAILDDMLGQPAKAVSQLEDLLVKEPAFKDEAEYNLGVSHYHLYSRDQIDKAIVVFEGVAQQTKDAGLRYMARAGLIRAFAMMVLHSYRAGNKQDAVKFAEKTTAESEDLLETAGSDASIDRKTRGEVRWRVLNGRGVAMMFSSDYEADSKTRKSFLENAMKDFESADKISANNWEIVCNLGSVHMRLAHVAKLSGQDHTAQAEFGRASQYLQDVIGRIRPNYGFALYELGRVCRLRGDFTTSTTLFEKALQLPEDERNISEKALRAEIEKARSTSDKFP